LKQSVAHPLQETSIMSHDGAPNSALLSFQTFGEKTTVPITVKNATICMNIPVVSKCLAVLELTVVNDVVKKDISSKLRLTLPVGTTVKSFQVLRNGEWYPATAVPNKTAKEVVYKEKEKGNAVAAVSNIGHGTSVFEIEVSPMPFEQEIKCRLELMGDAGSIERVVPNLFSDMTVVVVERATTVEAQVHNNTVVMQGTAVIGDCFGKTHFVCRIPSPAVKTLDK
jgi:hypothetical protein